MNFNHNALIIDQSAFTRESIKVPVQFLHGYFRIFVQQYAIVQFYGFVIFK